MRQAPRPAPFAALARRSHALVTGGSSGIGFEIARRLVAAGATVHVAARSAERLQAAVAELNAATAAGRAVAHRCDVTDAASVSELFEELRAEQASPGLVVNSAGRTVPGRFVDLELADFEATLEANFVGTLRVLQQAVPAMVERGEGYVLNVASVAALMGVYGMAPYSAAKFAVRGLTQTLRAELKWHGIAVSLLCPPDTATPMLRDEVPLRPAETEALSPSNEAVSAEFVARAAMRGWARGRAEILPGSTARLPALVARWSPGLLEWLMDRTVARVRSARD